MQGIKSAQFVQNWDFILVKQIQDFILVKLFLVFNLQHLWNWKPPSKISKSAIAIHISKKKSKTNKWKEILRKNLSSITANVAIKRNFQFCFFFCLAFSTISALYKLFLSFNLPNIQDSHVDKDSPCNVSLS